MGRMVIAPLDSQAVTSDAAQDLWSLMAGSTNKIILHGWEVSSDAITATLLECSLKWITAHGSGGDTTIVEKLLDTDDGAITGSVNARNTTPGTNPSDPVLAGYQWEQLGPLGQIYTPEMRPVIEISTGIALVCNTADDFGMSGWICWEEI